MEKKKTKKSMKVKVLDDVFRQEYTGRFFIYWKNRKPIMFEVEGDTYEIIPHE